MIQATRPSGSTGGCERGGTCWCQISTLPIRRIQDTHGRYSPLTWQPVDVQKPARQAIFTLSSGCPLQHYNPCHEKSNTQSTRVKTIHGTVQNSVCFLTGCPLTSHKGCRTGYDDRQTQYQAWNLALSMQPVLAARTPQEYHPSRQNALYGRQGLMLTSSMPMLTRFRWPPLMAALLRSTVLPTTAPFTPSNSSSRSTPSTTSRRWARDQRGGSLMAACEVGTEQAVDNLLNHDARLILLLCSK